jgi:hypothetical protein
MEVTSIVALLSIMLLLAFCENCEMMDQAESYLVKCITETALQNDPRFEWEDMRILQAQCEVILRLAGCTGRKSLAESYT